MLRAKAREAERGEAPKAPFKQIIELGRRLREWLGIGALWVESRIAYAVLNITPRPVRLSVEIGQTSGMCSKHCTVGCRLRADDAPHSLEGVYCFEVSHRCEA
jgi:hypothetical protein